MEIDEMYDLQEKLAGHFSKTSNLDITRPDIFNALFIVYEEIEGLEWGGDVWDLKFNLKDAIAALSRFNFDTLKNPIYTDDIIPKHCLFMEKKVRIKNSGRIWVIHKNDADPFPSNPHAHELSENIKLDLTNGKLYRKKKHLDSISKNELLNIRHKFTQVYKGKIPELAIDII